MKRIDKLMVLILNASDFYENQNNSHCDWL